MLDDEGGVVASFPRKEQTDLLEHLVHLALSRESFAPRDVAELMNEGVPLDEFELLAIARKLERSGMLVRVGGR